jgi:hypothetical protein
MVMTGSIPAEFHGARLSVVTTLVCDAQHENIDFAGDMPGRPALARRSFIRAAACSAGSSRRRTSPGVIRLPAGPIAPSQPRPRRYACYQYQRPRPCQATPVTITVVTSIMVTVVVMTPRYGDTPHARHSKVNSSDSPPKRGVLRTSFMG